MAFVIEYLIFRWSLSIEVTFEMSSFFLVKKILQYCGQLSLVGVSLFHVVQKELLRLVESKNHCSGLVLEH